MEQFKHITEWKLLPGSHEFPGPDGGTCINEAAIVAAGMEYREIDQISDLPPCFSEVLGVYAMFLNDAFLDSDRELLTPFVTQLSGTSDSPAVEIARFLLIVGGLKALPAYQNTVRFQLDATLNRFHRTNSVYGLRTIIPLIYNADGLEMHVVAEKMVGLLQEAILLGRHPTDQDIDLVNERLNAIKQKAPLKEKEAA